MPTSITMASASTVYYGPDSSNYAAVGSVGLNEYVQVYAMEKNWFFIEYSTGTSTKKRGYVSYSKINNAAAVADSVPTRSFTGYADVSSQNLTVCTGPGTSTVYPSPGTVYAGEGFNRFNETTGSYTYIEYSTSSGTKRGYALTSQLAGRNRGVLADVTAVSATVFTGPRNNYVTGGNVYLGEYVVILEKDPASASPAWYYVEFNSTSGRKRGYVDQSMITPYSSVSGLDSLKNVQGAASALQSLNVYAGPNSNFASIGSVSANEAVFTIEGASMESSYSYIEYTTSSGRKRGYVIASGLQILPGVFATMANAATVYNGPSAGIYASAGSVDLGEAVQVLGKEKSWFYIQYATSSNQKRGYVPYDTLNNPSAAAAGVPDRTFAGSADVASQELTVYTGPANSYATSGTVYSGEGVTKFNESINGYNYIEYSSPSGAKRGYAESGQLAGRNRGVLAEASSTPATIFSGPDETYFQSGGLYLEELVIILERDISSIYPAKWFHIEYNTSSGRKRGYINQNCLTPSASLGSVQELRTGAGLALAMGEQTVYSGPSPSYTAVGTIFNSERVSVLSSAASESSYAYIEYNTGGSASKRGYVQTGYLQPASVTLPVISIANVVEGVYGYSGNNRPLKYYKIGNGSNVLAAVFAVHGYEDAWAADGEELVKTAKTFVQEFAADNLSAWTVYVIPCANPDGILDGWTNNGPGRATVSAGRDTNRSFPANFAAYLQSRNYTGTTPLGAPEALALSEILLQWKAGATTMVLLDVHGWLNESIGDTEIGQYYRSQFGSAFNVSPLTDSARGYSTLWGQNQGMRAALVELPFPSSPQDIYARDFKGKFIQATRSLLRNIATSIPVTGIAISPVLATLNVGQTQQFTAIVSPANATNKTVTWSSSNSSIVTVDANGLATAGIAGGTASITATTIDGGFTAIASLSAAPAGLSFSYPNNAQVRGDFLYVRDATGNIQENQIVADGDIITVLDVGYTKQLAFIEYPTPSGVSSGYVTNATNIIKYYHLYEWKNGSTTEIVYDENGDQIGSISPRETATVLFQRNDGMYAIVYDTDKGANTKSGFVSYTGSADSDKPTQSTFSYPNNAKIEGDSLYVRDADGNILIGQVINDGTQITVLNVGYANQLALVEYPSNAGVLSGYIANATDLIKYFNPDEWINGSTIELVYDANGNQIGSLSPYETATPLFRKDGMTHVVYNTDKGANTKSGLVRYSGDGVYNDRGKTNPPEATGTPGNMIVSDEAVSFIATYEGFSATPYRGKDYQNLTIGYGHVILPGESFTSLTQNQALALLKSDLAGYERSVNNEFGTILNQNQFDALVSFCYNTGKNVWGKANLTNHVKAGASADTLRTDFTNWSYCNGERLQGLVNRRLDEWEMFVYADYVRTH